MTTYTIGYAVNFSNPDSQVHVSPLLFYQEPQLTHLNWVNTIFPKEDTLHQNKVACSEQLANYIRYYHPSNTLVIGGDQSTIAGACLAFNEAINIYVLSNNSEAVLTELPKLSPESQVHTISNDTPLNIEKAHPSILVIDSEIVSTSPQTLEQITSQPSCIVLFGYDKTQDLNNQIYTTLISFLARITS